MLAGGDQLGLGGSVQQVVGVLRGHEPLGADGLGRPVGVDHLPGGEVGRPQVADLPLPDQVVQGAEGLLDRRHGVGGVHLVEVDVIGPQPAQRPFQGAADRRARPVRLPVRCPDPSRRVTELGGQDHLVASALHRSAQQLLALARAGAVQLGAVQERHTGVEGRVHDRAGRGRVDASAERVAAEADRGHDEPGVTQVPVRHLGQVGRGVRHEVDATTGGTGTWPRGGRQRGT